MAIQMRRGAYSGFDPTKMVAGEFAVVLSGDPVGEDGEALYVALADGEARPVVTGAYTKVTPEDVAEMFGGTA